MATQKERLEVIKRKVKKAIDLLTTPVVEGENPALEPLLTEIEDTLAVVSDPGDPGIITDLPVPAARF